MTTYRQAVPSDVIDLIGLVEEYCDENKIAKDLPSVKKYIDFQLGKIPTVVAVEGDAVIGVISFVTMPNPFKHEQMIGRKIACFVSKDHRDKDIGATLIESAETICKQNGATKFYFSSPKQPEGYTAFETEYYKEL